MSGKRLVREIIDELGHAVVRESDCLGNVRYPFKTQCCLFVITQSEVNRFSKSAGTGIYVPIIKLLTEQNPPVLNWLMQVVHYNGRKMVVVVVVVVLLVLVVVVVVVVV